MSLPYESLLLGVLLITMVLAGTLLPRLLLSSAMVYLGVGYALGPGVLGVVAPDPFRHADALEWVAEVALLVSLFSVGLKMGCVSLRDRRWVLPLRLSLISMTLTVGFIAAVGHWLLDLSLGAAVLLGGILAPTDPVLAAGVQTENGPLPDRLYFSLSGEGGLNDGTASPFVMLGLGLLGWRELGAGQWRWWLVDVLWSMGGGLLIGAVLGSLIGGFVVHLRTRHQQAVGLDEFLSLGLVAIAYRTAQLCLASGFLAVLAAGLALRRVQERPREGTTSLGLEPSIGHTYGELSTHSHHASEAMSHAVLGFNEQLEKLAELAIVLLVGAMLPYAAPWASLWCLVPVLFILLRPLSVWLGCLGEPMDKCQRAMISWFGIRGIGSVFYLMFAIGHGVAGQLARQLLTLTLLTVAASIVAHGISVRPLMRWYARQGQR
ncbi:cation:proton antiporter [Chromobacterium sphagni]|uniref:Sodium:proton antiporter n=1 Tax=Chromobacterium sphagni TaxID=1903179 RepID=A0ABX3CAJ8_9NEIS|nr:cation:proton antiporter [Chromobacterium sphagni]OHX19198.1 sodium:proton antiporter [Chromobacterium sphagni]